MKLRAPLALFVFAAVAALVPLAYASPPDPSWIAGFWDDADYDDVVILAMASAEALTSSLPVAAFSPKTLGVVVHASPGGLAVGVRASRPIRAPPSA